MNAGDPTRMRFARASTSRAASARISRGHTTVTEKRTASCMYFGSVVHRRMKPVPHRFRNGVCSLLADLDELPDLTSRLHLFSFNRPNVFSFFERDHGPRNGSPLRPWIERHLRDVGIDLGGGPVRILCFP